jgi:alkyl hydroperoxide reductase subunit AhpC
VEKDADGDEGVALRATFIISDKGIVRHAEIADLPIGRNPEETVRLVQAFKFADEHGQVSLGLSVV